MVRCGGGGLEECVVRLEHFQYRMPSCHRQRWADQLPRQQWLARSGAKFRRHTTYIHSTSIDTYLGTQGP